MMIFKHFLWLVLLLPTCIYAQGQQLLQKQLHADNYAEIFADLSSWQASRAEVWATQLKNLPEEHQAKIIQDADSANQYRWPSLLATTYLEYQREGNRTHYESMVDLRSAKLGQLVLGEMLQQQGKYIAQIANGLWLRLEESTWVSPAHIVVQQAGSGLADPQDSYIDLWAARFSADLAAIYVGLAKELDAYSPQLRRRIKYELDKRILNPYLSRKDFWWMGYGKGMVNNWNIWINNNVLRTALLTMDDPEKQKQLVLKVLESSDIFIDGYPEDGACDEGASYWMHAGGELGTMLDLLTDASQQRFDPSQEKKLLHMGQYILNMHIDGNRFVNFADALAVEYPPPVKVFVFGSLFKDQQLKDFAAYLWNENPQIRSAYVQDVLLFAAKYPQIITGVAQTNKMSTIIYPSLQMVKWQAHPAGRGLTFVGIGGHNGVSHNHNDVGSFMLFADNEPVLIDIGVGTYTSKTFSSKRYEIWNMQSQWHNLPTINGQMQKDGKQFKATAVQLPSSKNQHSFSLDLSTAYPQEAAVSSWLRSFYFVPQKDELHMQEKYALTKSLLPQQLHFITAVKPIIEGQELSINYAKGARVAIRTNSKNLMPTVEELVLEDPRHQKIWGAKVYRIRYTEKIKQPQSTYDFVFKLIR